ncbi:MAG TPA: hypothetical protein VHF87_12645 [Methylomirabilota bacterium]|jgi:hypothetical protein|nr:hypothetical protein [Methylomirabilota bacterium]
MAKASLAIYLQDHLAGSAAAVEILETLRDEHAGTALGQFASEILVEVERDRAVLDDLIERVGGGGSVLKDTTAWLGAKLSRFKLGRELSEDLGTLEALEIVALGILGKKALWNALETIAVTDIRLNGVDLAHLTERARIQHVRVEGRRLEAARLALG